jgi:hypothetical protein
LSEIKEKKNIMQGCTCYKYYLKIKVFILKNKVNLYKNKIIDKLKKHFSKIKCTTKKKLSFKIGFLNKIKERKGTNLNINKKII